MSNQNPAQPIRTHGHMIVGEFEKTEWSRLAQNAYANDRNDLGHMFSGAAAIRKGEAMPIARYDALMDLYRIWLIDGLKAIPLPVADHGHSPARMRLQAELERLRFAASVIDVDFNAGRASKADVMRSERDMDRVIKALANLDD